MQNTYIFSHVNNYVVNLVKRSQLGFIADGKILYYESVEVLDVEYNYI